MTTTGYTEPTPPRRDVPRWILELEPVRPPRNPERALALMLKRLLRQSGMRCVSIRPVEQDNTESEGGDA